MVSFTAIVEKFEEKGEKTGWTYIDIPAAIASQLHPTNKQSFRVKGTINNVPIKFIALLPMGEGHYILPINAELKKKIGIRKGNKVQVFLEKDTSEFLFNQDFLDCVHDVPEALSFFSTLSASHQKYFSKWIDTAKTQHTKEKRIIMAVNALSKYMGFPEMIRANKVRVKDV